MTENTTTPLAADEQAPTAAKKVAVAKASKYDWREDMRKAGEMKDRATSTNKAAGARLWRACQAGVAEWLPTASDDVSGERLYGEFLEAYGESRKGDCSKMKTVALAAKDHGMVLTAFPNLAQAYAEARRLTQTVQREAAEDEAADKVIETLAADAPHTASTAESAAKIVLSKGLDEAARLLLDTLGADNHEAHRALVRAISAEVAGRVKPKTKTVVDAPKAGAEQVSGDNKPAKAKAKIANAGAKPKTKAAPVKEKAAPVKTGTKAAPVKASEKVTAEKVEADKPETKTEAKKVAIPVAKKAAPVRA